MFAQIVGQERATGSSGWLSKPVRLAALLGALTVVSIAVNSLIIVASGNLP